MKINKIGDRYWVYNSAKKWTYYFPFFESQQIYRNLKALVKKGVLLESSYNKRGYDKTLWHTLSDDKLSEVLRDPYWRKRSSKMKNTLIKNDEPIPYSYKTDIEDVMDGIEIF
tara:strand:+ start:3032 stop:3370 length:339 start_codon:yes stop_codon:yes gene_type:complete